MRWLPLKSTQNIYLHHLEKKKKDYYNFSTFLRIKTSTWYTFIISFMSKQREKSTALNEKLEYQITKKWVCFFLGKTINNGLYSSMRSKMFFIVWFLWCILKVELKVEYCGLWFYILQGWVKSFGIFWYMVVCGMYIMLGQ